MSSAILSTTCLTIINTRTECLHKGVADFKACLDNFCEDPARSCEDLNFFPAQTEPFD